MLLYWLWLANRPDVSDGLKCALIRQYGDPKRVYLASKRELAALELPGLSGKALAALADRSVAEEERILADCLRLGIEILTYGDRRYPERLRSIYDAPLVLYYRGILPDFDNLPTLAVVGTRKASAYGLQMADRMGRELAKGGALVVSGLAAGIDAAAMVGALNEGVPVVGVLGCGIDVVYPKSSRELYRQTECQGCILSEYAPGTPPIGWHFPKRNRILSGLSCGVVVVEAPLKSGALLTAKSGLEQGRDIFVVPGNVDMDGFLGSNRLLRDGAVAVSAGRDVLEEYRGIYRGKLHRSRGSKPEIPSPEPQKSEGKKQAPAPKREAQPKKTQRLPIDKGAEPPYSDRKNTRSSLSSEEQQVLNAICEASLVDDVMAACDLPPGKVLSILTMLELKGQICRLPGRRVARKRQ